MISLYSLGGLTWQSIAMWLPTPAVWETKQFYGPCHLRFYALVQYHTAEMRSRCSANFIYPVFYDQVTYEECQQRSNINLVELAVNELLKGWFTWTCIEHM